MLLVIRYWASFLISAYETSLFKGGGGFSPDFCKNTILRYELAMMARTCTNNLRVVLSPYVQHCPCEASEQKMGPKNQYIKQGDRA